MSTTYPAHIDTNQSLPTVVDNLTPVQGKVFNQLRDAVIAIESTLGAQANGLYSSVGSRVANLENIVGNLQIISLSQDIGGTLGSPLVVGLQGNPLSNAAPQANEVLTWNGIAWVPLPVNGFAPPGPSAFNLRPMVAGNFTTTSGTPIRIGASDIDMSIFPATVSSLTRHVHFKALIEATSITATTQIMLYDVTDGAVITGTIGSTSNYTGLILFDSGPLTVGTLPGQIRTDVAAIYEVRLAMTSGNPSTDSAICANARVEITYS
jgi:hypothetical protein